MFAIIALLCFVLAAFGVDIGRISLLALGLAFMALQMVYDWSPWGRPRP